MGNDVSNTANYSKQDLEKFLESATNTAYLPSVRIYFGMLLSIHYFDNSDVKNLKKLIYNSKIHQIVRLILADFLFLLLKKNSNYEQITNLLNDDQVPFFSKYRIISFLKKDIEESDLKFSKNSLENLIKILKVRSNPVEFKNLATDTIISYLKKSKDENFLLELDQKNIPKTFLKKIKSSFRIYNPLAKKNFELNLPLIKPSNISNPAKESKNINKNKLIL